MSKRANASIFDQLVEGLEASIAYSKGEMPLRATTLPPPPPEPTPKRIAALRKRHRMSQSVFAATLNVSTKTVQAWERGARRPNQASARLLQVIEHAPEAFFAAMAQPHGSGKRTARSLR